MFDFSYLALLKAAVETIYMVFIASFISISLGLFLGALLFLTQEKSALHRLLAFIINVTRSLPFIILMISIIPLTRVIVGTSIGTNAAIVPLALAAIPFFARITDSALRDVPTGLIEAAHALGATPWQIMTKVMIPESLPALIRGGTLTIIALISYSAMAGVVGGGGLGELAINYGYQRFNVSVMLATVIILVIMVELIQLCGDYFAKRRNVKGILLISVMIGFAAIVYQSWPQSFDTQNSLRVGVMSGWPEEVMQTAAEVAQKDYGIHLQIVTFNDYVAPNTALNNNSIDANIFQHSPYLNAQVKARHFKISAIAKTFVYPMGFYSHKISSLAELKDGAIVAIPNDPSNGGRALLLLEKVGLIQLRKDAGILAGIEDITFNPHHLKFKQLDAAQLPRTLKDADLVAVTNDFIIPSGLSFADALLKENKDSPYANIIVARDEDKNKKLMQQLVAIMHSKPVIQKTSKIFPHGAAIAAW